MISVCLLHLNATSENSKALLTLLELCSIGLCDNYRILTMLPIIVTLFSTCGNPYYPTTRVVL